MCIGLGWNGGIGHCVGVLATPFTVQADELTEATFKPDAYIDCFITGVAGGSGTATVWMEVENYTQGWTERRTLWEESKSNVEMFREIKGDNWGGIRSAFHPGDDCIVRTGVDCSGSLTFSGTGGADAGDYDYDGGYMSIDGWDVDVH